MNKKPWESGFLRVHENKRHFTNGDTPFFWLADTAWLMFQRLTLEETYRYLRNRKEKGYNVILVDFLHMADQRNLAGDAALMNGDFSKINTSGTFWSHIDRVMEMAEELGLYLGVLPVWGSDIVKNGSLHMGNLKSFMKFVLDRYHHCPNLIWIVGGDVRGDVNQELFCTMGKMMKEDEPDRLVTYFGEDCWRYVEGDYARLPVKPVLDGEPSYEWILQGLHDKNQPYWQAADVRRYAYWDVFAGAAGHTYGHNAVMQFHRDLSEEGSFGVNCLWEDGLHHSGSSQMKHLKDLMESVGFVHGKPAQQLLLSQQGEKYGRISVFAGEDFLMAYSYTGREIKLSLEDYKEKRMMVFWFCPATGGKSYIKTVSGQSEITETPPAGDETKDIVLLLQEEDMHGEVDGWKKV